MAARQLSATLVDRNGVAPAPQDTVASVDGFLVPIGDGRTIVEIANLDSVAHTVTFVTSATAGGIAVEDPSFTISSGATRWFGAFGPVFGLGGSVLVNTDAGSVNGKLGWRVYQIAIP